MIKRLCVAAVIFAVTTAFTTNSTIRNEPKKGAIYSIDAPANNHFQSINFPRLSTLLKRGVPATYKSVDQTSVIIADIKQGKNGTTQVVLQRKDGKKFFRYYTSVTADFTKALEKGELKAVK